MLKGRSGPLSSRRGGHKRCVERAHIRRRRAAAAGGAEDSLRSGVAAAEGDQHHSNLYKLILISIVSIASSGGGGSCWALLPRAVGGGGRLHRNAQINTAIAASSASVITVGSNSNSTSRRSGRRKGPIIKELNGVVVDPTRSVALPSAAARRGAKGKASNEGRGAGGPLRAPPRRGVGGVAGDRNSGCCEELKCERGRRRRSLCEGRRRGGASGGGNDKKVHLTGRHLHRERHRRATRVRAVRQQSAVRREGRAGRHRRKASAGASHR